MPLGIASRQQLLQQGWTRTRIEREVASGRLRRVRQGYYARFDAAPELVRAVRIGGVVTAGTALVQQGIWVPEHDPLHVAVAPNAGRLRKVEPDVVLHWGSPLGPVVRPPEAFQPVTDLPIALHHAMVDQAPAVVIALGDSALFHRRIDAATFNRVIAALPRRVRRAVERRFDGRSESGLESIVRFLLALEGIVAEPQVVISGVGRVDLLIAGWLIVELDGATHAEVRVMRNDRFRDANALQRGYRTLRFSSLDVLERWPHLLRTIRIALAHGAPGRQDPQAR